MKSCHLSDVQRDSCARKLPWVTSLGSVVLLLFASGCAVPSIKLPFGLDGLSLGQSKKEVQLSRPRSRTGDSCWCTGEDLGGDCLVEELDPADPFASTVLYCFNWGHLVEIKTAEAEGRSERALTPEQAVAGAVAGARRLWGEPDEVRVSGLAAGKQEAYSTRVHAVWSFAGSEVILSYALSSTAPGPLASTEPSISLTYARGRRGSRGLEAQGATANPAIVAPLVAAWPAPASVVEPMLR